MKDTPTEQQQFVKMSVPHWLVALDKAPDFINWLSRDCIKFVILVYTSDLVQIWICFLDLKLLAYPLNHVLHGLENVPMHLLRAADVQPMYVLLCSCAPVLLYSCAPVLLTLSHCQITYDIAAVFTAAEVHQVDRYQNRGVLVDK